MLKSKIEDGKILIIDDEPGNVKIFERVLKGAGFKNVTSITDSLKAVETYKKIRPDLILLDLKMPKLDGFGVMQALKEVETETYLPILVLTAQRDDATRLLALESGAKDFISKPFEMTEALTRVRNMLEVSLLHNEAVKIISNWNIESGNVPVNLKNPEWISFIDWSGPVNIEITPPACMDSASVIFARLWPRNWVCLKSK